jgi:hypothetical protein
MASAARLEPSIMPSATPLPRGPSHLALFGADDLLGAAGCPVCRYTAEASDRFFGWFALEGHAEATTITRLCRSLGCCPVHTRVLLGQPGAEGRMTAVGIYLMRAAAGDLADGTSPPKPCLACIRDTEAAQRALGTVLTGLRDDDLLRDRYRDADGLCLPHLRAALRQTRRRLATWLADDLRSRLAAAPPRLAVLAGQDADAEVRARLRAALPPAPVGDVCPACLFAAHAERDALAQAAEQAVGLCPAHLHDAATAPGPDPAPGPDQITEPGECMACQAVSVAEAQVLGMADARGPAASPPGLCVRHVLALRRRDPRTAAAMTRAAARRIEAVRQELEEAFRKRTWAHRNEPRGGEMTAWRRAPLVLDGRVYGGGPPGRL